MTKPPLKNHARLQLLPQDGTYPVAGIDDGDTLNFNAPYGVDTLRFQGMDTPEKDQPYGQISKQAFQQMLGDKPVGLRGIEKRGTYNRVIGRPYAGDTDTTLEMLRQGHAVPYFNPGDDQVAASQEAQDGRRGLYGMVDRMSPSDWRKAKRQVGTSILGKETASGDPDEWTPLLPGDYPERVKRRHEWTEAMKPRLKVKATRGDFMGGIARGVDQMQGDLYGLAHMFGNMVDSDAIRKFGVDGYKRNQYEASLNPAQGGAKGLRNVDGVGDFADWLQAKAGESLPFMASMVGGGGVGGVAAKVAAKKAASKLGKELTEAELKKQMVKGAAAGAFGSGLPMHTGETYEDIYQNTGIHAPGTAMGAGVLKSALDVAGGGAMLSPFLGEAKKQGLRAIGSGMGRGFLGEGLTESAQEAVGIGAREFVDPDNYNAISEDNAWRLAEAGLAGGFLGGGVGGISGAANMAQDRAVQEQVTEDQAIQEQIQEQAVQDQELPGINTSPEAIAASQALEAEIEAGNVTTEKPALTDKKKAQQERKAKKDAKKAELAAEPVQKDSTSLTAEQVNEVFESQDWGNANTDYIKKQLEYRKSDMMPRHSGDSSGNSKAKMLRRSEGGRLLELMGRREPEYAAAFQKELDDAGARLSGKKPDSEDMAFDGSKSDWDKSKRDEWAKDDKGHLRNKGNLQAQSQVVQPDKTLLEQREQDHEGVDGKRFKDKLDRQAAEKKARLDKQMLSSTSTKPTASEVKSSGVVDPNENADLAEETEHGVVEEEHNPAINVSEREEGKTFEAEFVDAKNKPYGMGVVEGRVFNASKATPAHGMKLTEQRASFLQPPMRKAYDQAVQYNKDTYDGKGLITLRKDKNNNYSVEVSQFEQAKDALPPLKEEDTATIKKRIEGAKRVAANKFQGALLFKNPEGKNQLLNLHELTGLGLELAEKKQGTNKDSATVSDLHAIQAGLAAAQLEGYSLQHGGKDIKTIGDLEGAFQHAMNTVAGYKASVGNKGGANYARSAAKQGLDYFGKKSVKGLSSRVGKIPAHENVKELEAKIQEVRTKVKSFNDAHAKNNIGVVRALNSAVRDVMEKNFESQEEMEAALLNHATKGKDGPLLSTQKPPHKPKKFQTKEQLEAEHARQLDQTGRIKKDFKPKSPAEQWASDIAEALSAKKKIENAYATTYDMVGGKENDIQTASDPGNVETDASVDHVEFGDAASERTAEEYNNDTRLTPSNVGNLSAPAKPQTKFEAKPTETRMAGQAKLVTKLLNDVGLTQNEVTVSPLKDSNAAGRIVYKAKGKVEIQINQDLVKGAAEKSFVLSHEFGHMVQETFLSQAPETVKRQIWEAYKGANPLMNPKDYPFAASSIFNGVNEEAEASLRERFSKEQLFREWFANEVATWAVKHYGGAKPRNAVESFLDSVVNAMKKLWNTIRKNTKWGSNATVGEYMDALVQYRRGGSQPNSMAKELQKQSDKGRYVLSQISRGGQENMEMPKMRRPTLAEAKEVGTNTFDLGRKILRKMFASTDGSLRAMKMDRIADLMHLQPGNSRKGKMRPMHEAIDAEVGKYGSQINRILNGMNSESEAKILQALKLEDGKMTGLTPKEKAAYKTIRKFFDDLLLYQNGPRQQAAALSGLSAEHHAFRQFAVDQRQHYMPRNWDHQKIQDNWDTFVGEVFKGDYSKATTWLTGVQAEQTADPTESTIGNPHSKSRSLDVDPAIAAKYTSDDMAHTLISYLNTAVRRTEWDRRFGGYEKTGEIVNKKRLMQFNSNAVIQQESDKLSPDDKERFNTLINGVKGTLGNDLTQNQRKALGWAQLWQNALVLPFATFASFPDLANPYVRGGSAKPYIKSLSAIKDAAKLFTKGERSRIVELAALTGSINERLEQHAMIGQTQEDWMGSERLRRWNEKFFRYIGMHHFTQTSRIVATAAAENFIINAASESDTRFLDELNLNESDVEAWVKDGKPLNNEKVNAAITQFVHESTFKPNASVRPAWANNPKYKLIWHLHDFMYGFQKFIAQRMTNRWKADGWKDPKAMMQFAKSASTIGALMPLAMLGMESRDFLKYGVWGGTNKYRDKMSTEEYIWESFMRSGGLGVFQMVADADRAAEWNRSVVTSLGGPIVGWMEHMISKPLDKTVIKSIPGLNQRADVFYPMLFGGDDK